MTAFVLIAGSARLVHSQASEMMQPIALSPSSSGGLFVLDKVGGVVRIPGGLDIRNSYSVASFRASWQPIDMASVGTDPNEHIFVLLSQGSFGMLMQYTGDGKFEGSWISTTLLSGLAIDSKGHRCFMGGVLTGELYYFAWDSPPRNPIKSFTSLSGAQTLGPLTVDEDRSILYVGDARTGAIFAVDLNSKTNRQVAQIGGQPTALAFDSPSRKLYIADGAGRKVWVMPVDAKLTKPAVFSVGPDFRQPSAITISTGSIVWLGDQDAKAIFQISPKGSVVTTYHPSLPVSTIGAFR